MKKLNSDIKCQFMHHCVMKLIHSTLKGLPHDILYLVKEAELQKKKGLGLFVGHQITERFTL